MITLSNSGKFQSVSPTPVQLPSERCATAVIICPNHTFNNKCVHDTSRHVKNEKDNWFVGKKWDLCATAAATFPFTASHSSDACLYFLVNSFPNWNAVVLTQVKTFLETCSGKHRGTERWQNTIVTCFGIEATVVSIGLDQSAGI